MNTDKVQIDYTSFGTLNALKLKLELNNWLRYEIHNINAWLATLPLVVPSNIAGLFELSNLTIEYFNDYLYLGATPTFIGVSANQLL